jgi:uncharacterized membrane protein YccC
MEHRRFNALGAGLTLASAAVPWYIAYFCQSLLAYWLFNLPQPPWLVLTAVIAGGVLSLFSRYGGLLTIVASLFFAATFTTGQLSQLQLPPTWLITTPCTSSNLYGVHEPTALHTIGDWIALAGGVLTVALGASWTAPFHFMTRHSPTGIVGPRPEEKNRQ